MTLSLFSLFFISTVSAHSVLEKATPEKGAALENSITKIELSFNTKIENGSTLYLVNKQAEEVHPNSVNINNTTLIGKFDELKSGAYQVYWKIIGADGHIIENQYSFTVATTQEEALKSDDGKKGNRIVKNNDYIREQKDKQNNGEVETNTLEDSETKASSQDTNNEGDSSLFIYGIIILLFFIMVILFLWLLFSKSKKIKG